MLAASVGALIFTGALSGSLGRGIGFALAGASVSLLVMGWRGVSPGTIGGLQASVAVVLAVVVSRAAEDVALEAAAFVLVAVATIVVGVVLAVAGKLRLANIIRFVPFPVVGGFLAGTGAAHSGSG